MNFFGILSHQGRTTRTKRILFPKRDRNKVAEDFLDDVETYLDLEPKTFDPGYKLEEEEIFRIDDFELPEHLVWTARNPEAPHDIQRSEVKPGSIKALVGVSLNPPTAEQESSVRVAAFKVLNRSRIVEPSRNMFEWSGETFVRKEEPAIIIPDGLDAVYTADALYFKTFQTTNSFLDLTDHFTELSNESITGVLEEVSWLVYESVEIPMDRVLNQTCRRLFSMINRSEGFAEMEVERIVSRAEELGFDLNLSDDRERIVLPTNSKDMKHHLEFLLQRYYPGIFDGRLRRATSSEIVNRSDDGS